MRNGKSSLIAMAFGAILAWGAGARADFTLNYLPTGIFTGGATPGTPTFTAPTDPGTTITFTNSPSSATVPPPNQVSLGTFTTASGSATSVALSGGFDLTILNTDTSDSITFHGVLSGSISATSSTAAHILFSGPLEQVLDGFTIMILSADSSVPGEVNLGAPTTNGGVTTVNGEINFVPEPSSLALLGLGGPALAGLAYRRIRRKADGGPAT